MNERKPSAGSNNADVFGTIQSAVPTPIPASQGDNDPSTRGIDKPLPTISSANGSPAKPSAEDMSSTMGSSTATQRRSMHSRQPASDVFDRDEPLPQTTPQRALASFSEDVNGMFSGIGETHLANELGLPPDSLRVKARPANARSPVSDGTQRFPLDLGKPLSEPRAMPVPSRTTSLPAKADARQASLAPLTLSRTPSSPNLQSQPLTPISRTSSKASAQLEQKDQQPVSDFGPAEPSKQNEDTLKGHRTREISGATITGSKYASASVRLVGSPRPQSVHTLASPGRSDQEWVTSPTTDIQSNEATEDSGTPGASQDDEERGRRLACEFLEDDYRSMAYDKVAMFLGGP